MTDKIGLAEAKKNFLQAAEAFDPLAGIKERPIAAAASSFLAAFAAAACPKAAKRAMTACTIGSKLFDILKERGVSHESHLHRRGTESGMEHSEDP